MNPRALLTTFAVFIVSTVVLSVLLDSYRDGEADRSRQAADRAERVSLQKRNEDLQEAIQEWATGYRVLVAWLQGQHIAVPEWIIDPSLPSPSRGSVDDDDDDSSGPRSGSKSQEGQPAPKAPSRGQNPDGGGKENGNESSGKPDKPEKKDKDK